MTLLDAVRDVMSDKSVTSQYPKEGLNAADVLKEIRIKYGDDAFPYVSVIDVADELQAFYGKKS